MSFEIKKREEYCDICDRNQKLFFKKKSRNVNTLGINKEIVLCSACANKLEVEVR